jgi:phasin
MTDTPPFEIPSEFRALAETNVEQARAAYCQFMNFLTQATDAYSKAPSSTTLPGLGAIPERALEFTKENAERFFDLANELAHAKDMQEVLTLQSRYVQTQMQSYADQAKELGRLIAKTVPAFGRAIAIP